MNADDRLNLTAFFVFDCGSDTNTAVLYEEILIEGVFTLVLE